VSDADTTSKNFVSRVEENLRADVKADEGLGKQLLSDLMEKLEDLEKRITELERRA
jgi:archaellum component FlaC